MPKSQNNKKRKIENDIKSKSRTELLLDELFELQKEIYSFPHKIEQLKTRPVSSDKAETLSEKEIYYQSKQLQYDSLICTASQNMLLKLRGLINKRKEREKLELSDKIIYQQIYDAVLSKLIPPNKSIHPSPSPIAPRSKSKRRSNITKAQFFQPALVSQHSVVPDLLLPALDASPHASVTILDQALPSTKLVPGTNEYYAFVIYIINGILLEFKLMPYPAAIYEPLPSLQREFNINYSYEEICAGFINESPVILKNITHERYRYFLALIAAYAASKLSENGIAVKQVYGFYPNTFPVIEQQIQNDNITRPRLV